jgi:hypothetical protein
MSRKQEIWMFQALDIPFTTTGVTLTDDMGLLRSSAAITPAVAIMPEIEAYITGTANLLGPPPGTINGITYPPMDSETLVELKTYIDRWGELKFDTDEVVLGSVGGGEGVTQVDSSPFKDRKLLRESIRGLVPFYTKYAWMMKQAGESFASAGGAAKGGGGNNASIPMIR